MMQQIATTQTPAATAARLPGRTVLVHDYLNQHGGAERLLEVMHDLAPEAPVFTSMYDPDSLPPTYRAWDIRTTWMNRLPGVTSSHQRYLPVYPLAFEQLRLPDCDLVLSSSSAFAKAVRPPIGAAHVAYIHSPMRFAWNLDGYVERERIKPAMRGALRPLMAAMRRGTAGPSIESIASQPTRRQCAIAFVRSGIVIPRSSFRQSMSSDSFLRRVMRLATIS